MGEKIQKAFEKIMEAASLSERMAVSMKAGIPSAKAKTIPDDYKNITLMKRAVNTVFDELSDHKTKAKKHEILSVLSL